MNQSLNDTHPIVGGIYNLQGLLGYFDVHILEVGTDGIAVFKRRHTDSYKHGIEAARFNQHNFVRMADE